MAQARHTGKVVLTVGEPAYEVARWLVSEGGQPALAVNWRTTAGAGYVARHLSMQSQTVAVLGALEGDGRHR